MSLTIKQDAALVDSTPVLDPQPMERLRYIADCILIAWARGDDWAMYGEWSGVTDPEEQLVVWAMLRPHSKVRSAIKGMQEVEKHGLR